MAWFLKKAFGSPNIDKGMLDYDYLTTHQPGAQHAPYYFVAGYLFSQDILRIYQDLPMPVWFSHGVRGDFVDYRDLPRFAGRRNWTVERLPTGAFPHFEDLAAGVAGGGILDVGCYAVSFSRLIAGAMSGQPSA